MRGLVRTACNWGLQILILIVLLVIIAPLAATTGGIAVGTIVMAAFFRNLFRRLTGGASEDSELPKYTFYDTIEEFGYHFNDKGELVDDQGGRFKFVVKENDRNYNQQHYDALGELITEYLYGKMETDLQLRKIVVPVDAKKEEAQGFIFESEGAQESKDLMVIINGAGVVRAGQWSRKLIINEDIDTGTQFPYIRRARDDGYGVLILNTNQNKATVNGKSVEIRGSSNAEDHGLYVWEHIISKTKATNIVIVAHSYGGIVTCNIAEKFLEDFKKRVFCIVFTDSVHSAERDRWSQPVKDYMKERAVNFASTYVPINYIMEASHPDDCLSISAGTKEHERTSHSCIDSAFQFIRDNHATWTKDGTMAPRDNFLPLPEDLSEYSPAKRWEQMKAEEAEKASTSKSADKQVKEDTKPKTEKDDRKEKDVGKVADSRDQDLPSKNGGRDQEKDEPKTDQSGVQVTAESKSVEVTAGEQESKPVEVTAGEQESKPVEVTAGEQESKPVEVTAGEQEYKPVEVTESEQESKPAEVTAGEQESKPTEVTAGEQESKPVEMTAGEQESKPVESETTKEKVEDEGAESSQAEVSAKDGGENKASIDVKDEQVSAAVKQAEDRTESKKEETVTGNKEEKKKEEVAAEARQEEAASQAKQEDLSPEMEQKNMNTGGSDGQKTGPSEAEESKEKTGETEGEEKDKEKAEEGDSKEKTEKKEEQKAEVVIPEQTTEL